jgi:hypothetical protein
MTFSTIRTLIALAIASTLPLAAAAEATTKVPNAPTGEIEKRYYENGPYEVSHHPEFGCCDSAGFSFDVYAPRDLTQVDGLLPIITFGNGTDAQPYYYDYLLRHLASWGFAIVATRQPNTGIGTELHGEGKQPRRRPLLRPPEHQAHRRDGPLAGRDRRAQCHA